MKICPVLRRSLLAATGVLLLLIISLPSWGQQKVQFPSYSGHVNDFANVIDANTKYQLETILTNFEQKSGTQIAVVTLTTLGDQSLENYANGLYRTWGIGAKSGANRDKGALLLLVTQDRKTRLEVGYGLEGDLPDGLAGEIIRRMRPELQKQPSQYSAGLTVGVRTLVDTLAQKWNLDVTGIDRSFAYQPQLRAPEGEADSIDKSQIIIFGIIIILILLMVSRNSGRGGRGGSGGGHGGSGWWAAPMIFHQGGGGFGGSSWGSGGGWSGGSSGGGSDSWGGFGGGSSGGGGASDSW